MSLAKRASSFAKHSVYNILKASTILAFTYPFTSCVSQDGKPQIFPTQNISIKQQYLVEDEPSIEQNRVARIRRKIDQLADSAIAEYSNYISNPKKSWVKDDLYSFSFSSFGLDLSGTVKLEKDGTVDLSVKVPYLLYQIVPKQQIERIKRIADSRLERALNPR